MKTDRQLLKKEGWEIVCQSPYEIEDGEGSSASGRATQAVVDGIKSYKTICKTRKLIKKHKKGLIIDNDFYKALYNIYNVKFVENID